MYCLLSVTNFRVSGNFTSWMVLAKSAAKGPSFCKNNCTHAEFVWHWGHSCNATPWFNTLRLFQRPFMASKPAWSIALALPLQRSIPSMNSCVSRHWKNIALTSSKRPSFHSGRKTAHKHQFSVRCAHGMATSLSCSIFGWDVLFHCPPLAAARALEPCSPSPKADSSHF